MAGIVNGPGVQVGMPAAHGLPRYERIPPDYGWLAHTFDQTRQSSGATPGTAGLLQLVRIRLPVPALVSHIHMYATAGGSSLTAGRCFAGLFTTAGARVGVTDDQAAAWATLGLKGMSLAGGPVQCAAGDYDVGFFFNGTTSPSWARAAGTGAALTNAGLSNPNYMAATADTGLTTAMPTTVGVRSTAAIYYWAALSGTATPG